MLDPAKLKQLLAVIEDLAAGNLDSRFSISSQHDDLDAIGIGVNMLAEELSATIARLEREATARMTKESELKRSEQRQEVISEEIRDLRLARLASIGALAAGVGHEINNPLTYVMGNLEFLLMRLSTVFPETSAPEVAEIYELIRESSEGADRIHRIVRDLRLFARVDDNSVQPIDVREVMESSLTLTNNEIRHRARLERIYHEVPNIQASEPRLAQVFVNLLVNAAHSLPMGGASAHVIRVTIAREGDDRVRIEIQDSGTGISAENLTRVFDPFYSTKPHGEGTGLGLPICRELIAKMGGEISVESELSVGTTFRVVIPIGDSSAESDSLSVTASVPESAQVAHVLIIDDDRSVAMSLSRMLVGIESTIVPGGREALELLATSSDFDIIFCDLMMPDMSGMEVYEEIERSASPQLLERFVFITGGAFGERANRFLASVHNLCLTKPFESSEINQLVLDRAERRRR